MCTDNNTAKKRYLNPVPDIGVLYTGPDVPALGIVKDCIDLRLSDIEAIILNRLQAHATGQGIKIETITGNCQFVNDYLSASDKSLASLIQGLYNNDCTLRELIKTVDDKIEPPFPFDLKCFTTVLPPAPSQGQIIQAILNNGCSNTERLDKIESDLAIPNDPNATIMSAVKYVIGNMVTEMFTSCQDNLRKSGAGVQAKINIIGTAPKGTILYGVFDRSSFDDNGLGLESKGMCGWHLANGNGGTVDVRGFTLASTIDTQGPALNALVLPSNNVDFVAAYLTRKGPKQGSVVGVRNNTSTTAVGFTGINVRGVTGTSGQPIDFRQPTIYLRAIQRIA